MVDSGQKIDVVLEHLENWLKNLPYITPHNYIFVTCGDWDICSCLKHEAKHKELLIKPFLRQYINIKKYFVKVFKGVNKPVEMMHMLNLLGLKH